MENSVLFAYMVLRRVMRIYLDKRDMSGTKLENETHWTGDRSHGLKFILPLATVNGV